MEFTKKMVLVPSETVEKFQQGPVATDPMDALHSELTQVLRSRSLNDSEKWARYQQLLERCLRYADQRRKPFTFSIEEGSAIGDRDDGGLNPELPAVGAAGLAAGRAAGRAADPMPLHARAAPVPGSSGERKIEDVLATVPMTYRSKGSVLLGKLVKSGLIDWKDDGRVQIENKLIPGAHISDLINDVLRDRKTAQTPAGGDEFYKALAKLNVPNELIGNPRRWDVIRRFALGFASPGSPSVGTLWPETPYKTGAKPKHARKLDWESFSFSK